MADDHSTSSSPRRWNDHVVACRVNTHLPADLAQNLFIAIDTEQCGPTTLCIAFTAVTADRICKMNRKMEWYEDVSDLGKDQSAVAWQLFVRLPFSVREISKHPDYEEFWRSDPTRSSYLDELITWVRPSCIEETELSDSERFNDMERASVTLMYKKLSQLLDNDRAPMHRYRFVSDAPARDGGVLNGLLRRHGFPESDRMFRKGFVKLPRGTPEYDALKQEYNAQMICMSSAMGVLTNWRDITDEKSEELGNALGYKIPLDKCGVHHTHDPLDDSMYVALQYRRIYLAMKRVGHASHIQSNVLGELCINHHREYELLCKYDGVSNDRVPYKLPLYVPLVNLARSAPEPKPRSGDYVYGFPSYDWMVFGDKYSKSTPPAPSLTGEGRLFVPKPLGLEWGDS